MSGCTKTSHVISCNGYDAVMYTSRKKESSSKIFTDAVALGIEPTAAGSTTKGAESWLTALFAHMLNGIQTCHASSFLISLSPPSMCTFASVCVHPGQYHHVGEVKRCLMHGNHKHMVIAFVVSMQRRLLPLCHCHTNMVLAVIAFSDKAAMHFVFRVILPCDASC